MFENLIQRYAADLDAKLQQLVGIVYQTTPAFGVMLRYPMGWVDQQDQPYTKSTGKRIRPLLLLLSTETAGGDWRQALPAAAAVELLHNFSLIHDDIQDNSPTRHNRPTVWKQWGFADAINAGDAMFALSYVALEQLSQESNLKPESVLQVWRVFNEMVLELTRGQYLDMSFEERQDVSVDQYISMISGKSAALLSATAQIGALIATEDTDVAQHYAEFGLNLGIAFQIRDDILGIWGNPDVTGKSVATDILSRKKSLPVLYGLANSEALQRIYQRESFSETEVIQAVRILDELNAQAYTRQKEREYYERALQAFSSAKPEPPHGDQMRQFIELLFSRSH